MADSKAVVRVEHPDIVLTETVTHDRRSTVKSVSEAGTDPTPGTFFYHIESSDFSRFEAEFRKDPTVGDFERVIETGGNEAIYSFEYTDEAKILSPVVSAANGVILEMETDGSAWIQTIWIPERTDLAHRWDYAEQHDTWWNPELETNIALGYVPAAKLQAATDAPLDDSIYDAAVGVEFDVHLPDEYAAVPGEPVAAAVANVPFKESANPSAREQA